MEEDVLLLGGARVDLARRQVVRGGEAVRLSPLETRLLRFLGERRGQLVSKDELLQQVWGYQPGVISRAVDNTVARLRPKIELDPADPNHLLSAYGGGYRLEPSPGAAGATSTTFASLSDEYLPSAFFGRRHEQAAIREALEAGAPVVTIVGTAGMGKTRLARHLAHRLAPPQGAGDRAQADSAFADLSRATTAAEVRGELRRILGLPDGPEAGQLARALEARGWTLVVLDNVEQALAPVREVLGELLNASSPRWLLTSREATGLAAESVVELGPLEERHGRALFLARARHARGEAIEDEDGVNELVARLDGMPLAIESPGGVAPSRASRCWSWAASMRPKSSCDRASSSSRGFATGGASWSARRTSGRWRWRTATWRRPSAGWTKRWPSHDGAATDRRRSRRGATGGSWTCCVATRGRRSGGWTTRGSLRRGAARRPRPR